MSKHQVILCIVNSGFTDEAMDAAKQCGARGGTVFHARGTVSKEAEKFFNITVQPEKEIVMILVDEKIKDNILKSLASAFLTNIIASAGSLLIAYAIGFVISFIPGIGNLIGIIDSIIPNTMANAPIKITNIIFSKFSRFFF